MQTILTADQLISPDETIANPIVTIEDGRISSIASRSTSELPSGHHLDFAGGTLVPAFFDVHIHGSAGHDVMEATPEAFTAVDASSHSTESVRTCPQPLPCPSMSL